MMKTLFLLLANKNLQLKVFFAEYISPIVSRLRKIDPTIHRINLGEFSKSNEQEFNNFGKTVMEPDIVSHLQQISSVHSIEINEEEAIKLRFISILLDNDESHCGTNSANTSSVKLREN